MSLIQEIMTLFANNIVELGDWLEKDHNVDPQEFRDTWFQISGMKIVGRKAEVSEDEVQSVEVGSTKSVKSNKKIPKTKDQDMCQHTFKSGGKAGEQCTTKPKGGAQYCATHRPKGSVASTKGEKKATKKKEVKTVKSVEKIDSDFESDTEEDTAALKEKEAKKKEAINKKAELAKKIALETGKHKIVTHADGTQKKVVVDTSEEDSDMEALSEPETPVKPLLKKKTSKVVAKPTKQYDTDDEKLDIDLNLSDDE